MYRVDRYGVHLYIAFTRNIMSFRAVNRAIQPERKFAMSPPRKKQNRPKISLQAIFMVVTVVMLITAATATVVGKDVSNLILWYVPFVGLAPLIWTKR